MDNNDEGTTYQYFTIKNEEENFIGLQDILDIPTTSSSSSIPQEEINKPIFYLTFNEDNNTECKNADESTQMVATCNADDSNSCSSSSQQNPNTLLETNNINLITLEDGRMFMTTNLNLEPTAVQSPLVVDSSSLAEPISLEDKNETDDSSNLQIISNDELKEEIINADNSEEANYQLIQLTDGTQALIKIYKLKTEQSVVENFENDDLADEVEEDLEPPPKKAKKFQCFYEGCNKCYATSYHLTVHTRSHTDCRPYECKTEGCDKKFSTNYSLKAHIRTHTGEKPYGCTVCGKQFKTSGDLQKHIRIHTGEKPFLCPIAGCGKSFTTSNIRKVHVRSHTGERPYSCPYPICGKAFTSSTNYKNHLRIHSGEKPYACPVEGCGKRFTEYSSLYKHNAVHLPVRPHVCVFCGQKFKQESALNSHKRLKHNVVVTRDGTEIIVKLE